MGLPAPQLLRLPDGRALAWYEFGDADGVPCIYTTGTPASGLAGMVYGDAARRAGIRWISVDKPGYGHSDFHPDRSLLDWPEDIAALADHLGLARFAVAGESGGGPHALALAYRLPQRVELALVIAGMGPGHEAWVRKGMKPTNRQLFWLAQHAPWLLRVAMQPLLRAIEDPLRRERWVQRQLSASPRADRALLERMPDLLPITFAAVRDAMRVGSRGAVQEMQLFARPWGFDLNDIRVPVHIWHGTEDVNVPVAIARRVAEEIPGCIAHFIDGVGHGLYEHMAEMLDPVARTSGVPL